MTTPMLYDGRGRPLSYLKETTDVGHPDIYGAVSDDMEKFLSSFENVDVLVGKHGFNVYEDMWRRDGQVKSGLWYQVSISLSPKPKVDPVSDDQEDQKWARFVEYNFQAMRGSRNQLEWDMRRGSWGSGTSILEINYRIIDEPGEWQGMIGIDSVKPRYPDSFEFHPDRHGNLNKRGQLWQEKQNGQTEKNLDPDKFIIYPNDPTWSNWWGNSDLQQAYRPYTLKDWAFRWWAIFLEHFGGPVPIGRYDEFTAKGERDKWLKVLKKMKMMGAVIFPKSWDIELHSVSGVHTDAFDKMVAVCDKQIARAILVPELLQSEGQTHGSYGLGVMQYWGPFIGYLKFKDSQAEEVLNERLIKQLIRKNDPERNVWAFPRATRDEIREVPDANVLQLFKMILEKPNWSDGLDPTVAQYISSATGLPIPEGIVEEKTSEIDEAAEEANELMSLMADQWRKRKRLSRLPELRSLHRRFAKATVPGIDLKQADDLAMKQTAEWSNRLTELAEKKGEEGFAEFDAELALWAFRKELKSNGGRTNN